LGPEGRGGRGGGRGGVAAGGGGGGRGGGEFLAWSVEGNLPRCGVKTEEAQGGDSCGRATDEEAFSSP
jgi:hypothetical protein